MICCQLEEAQEVLEKREVLGRRRVDVVDESGCGKLDVRAGRVCEVAKVTNQGLIRQLISRVEGVCGTFAAKLGRVGKRGNTCVRVAKSGAF